MTGEQCIDMIFTHHPRPLAAMVWHVCGWNVWQWYACKSVKWLYRLEIHKSMEKKSCVACKSLDKHSGAAKVSAKNQFFIHFSRFFCRSSTAHIASFVYFHLKKKYIFCCRMPQYVSQTASNRGIRNDHSLSHKVVHHNNNNNNNIAAATQRRN